MKKLLLKSILLLCIGSEGVDEDGGTEDAHIGQWAVVLVSCHLLNLVDDIEALQHLAKDGILAVEVGRAASSLVDVNHLGGELYTAVGEGVEALLYAADAHIVHLAAPDDIELAGAGAHVGVDIVGFPGGSDDATAVEDMGEAELGFGGVVEVASAKQLAWLGVLAVEVATLNHEVFDDTVEE